MYKKSYKVFAVLFYLSILLYLPLTSAQTAFIRGDANSDNKVDISDSTFINNYLNLGGVAPVCSDAADANDDGKVDISDGVYLNNFLYLGGSKPPVPFPSAGVDTTNDSLSCGNEGGQGGLVCQASFCDVGIKESDEGPGGDDCVCSNNAGDAGYEECFSYMRKSTAYIPKFFGLFSVLPEKSATDYCVDQETLNDVGIDCEWANQDIFVYKEKDCNDYNQYTDWESYCDGGKVLRHRKYYDYGCDDGICAISTTNYLAPEIISQVGDDSYCSDKIAYCGQKCTQGEYDCDEGQCSAGLECKSDWNALTSDGCCQAKQQWDTTKLKCVDCLPGDGPCCDANGKFKLTDIVCNSDLGVAEYACNEGNCLNQDVWKRTKKQLCSGESSDCNGNVISSNPVKLTDCSASQYCKGSKTWSSTQPSCTNAQCTSGECCNTDCGVYTYRPATSICSSKTEEGCPWGTNLDNNAGKRDGRQFCSGNGKDCTTPVSWDNWVVKQDCSNVQYCILSDSISSCQNIACSKASDCGTNGFIDQKMCKDNNVWDKWRTWTCNNPGTKSSSCSYIDEEKLKTSCAPETVWLDEYFCEDDDVYERGARYTYTCNTESCVNTGELNLLRLKEDCQNGCEILSSTNARCKGLPPPPTCSDGIKNQDETGIDCGGVCSAQGKKCTKNESCKINSDCQSDYCNPSTKICENAPSCTNNCSPAGATQCSSPAQQQTCGNYDTDTCLEWGGTTACEFGCASNICREVSKPDLTVTSFIVQYPRTGTIPRNSPISLAFTIKNQGTAQASSIFWKLQEPGHFDRTNANGISLAPGSSTAVFVTTSYTSPGTYIANLTLDANNIIKELNEDNSKKTIT